jgi:hypothetical protein
MSTRPSARSEQNDLLGLSDSDDDETCSDSETGSDVVGFDDAMKLKGEIGGSDEEDEGAGVASREAAAPLVRVCCMAQQIGATPH